MDPNGTENGNGWIPTVSCPTVGLELGCPQRDVKGGTNGYQWISIPKETQKWELMDPSGWMSPYEPGNGN